MNEDIFKELAPIREAFENHEWGRLKSGEYDDGGVPYYDMQEQYAYSLGNPTPMKPVYGRKYPINEAEKRCWEIIKAYYDTH